MLHELTPSIVTPDLFSWEGDKLEGKEDNCGVIEAIHFNLLNYIY